MMRHVAHPYAENIIAFWRHARNGAPADGRCARQSPYTRHTASFARQLFPLITRRDAALRVRFFLMF